jgi:His-Xaa-Ser system radical SAM maturase HxsB
VRPVFLGPEQFAPRAPYQLLPFRFLRLDDRRLVVNLAGEHELLSERDFQGLVDHTLSASAESYDNLKAKHFLADTGLETATNLLAVKLRTKYEFLAGFTRLHIFVVSLRCDHSCSYCQVSRVGAERSKYDMTPEMADAALDLVFRSPARRLKLEFQGGEPLLNFDLIRHIVGEANRRNALRTDSDRKDLAFVITTNLSLVDDAMLRFCGEHQIAISTSLDGPAFIHNANRPRPGRDSYERTIAGIQRARAALGHDAVSALMTTTRLSLDHPETIVDEYVAQGFDHVFVRPISPYGFAVRTRARTGYERSAFLDFYERALGHIIEVNRRGKHMVEIYAQILLTKILTPYATGYVDLRSPAGAGIGAVVYNYDGDVYASDESRMLAEMGDKSFRLGRLGQDTYEQIFGGDVLRRLVLNSITEAIPSCTDCALLPFCGSDPIENHATQGDIVGHRPTSEFCERNMGIMKLLLRLYHGPDSYVHDLFHAWTLGSSIEALIPAVGEV